MTRGLIFWVLMLVWFVFGLVTMFGGSLGGYAHIAAGVDIFLFFILFVLLGWQVYGPPVRG